MVWTGLSVYERGIVCHQIAEIKGTAEHFDYAGQNEQTIAHLRKAEQGKGLMAGMIVLF